jgi:hypothetical protein
MPSPRAFEETHIRFSSAGPRPWNFTAPAPTGVEAAVEPPVQLVEVGLQAALRVRAGGVFHRDHHHRPVVGRAHARAR